MLGRAGEEGQARRRTLVRNGTFKYRQDHRLSEPESTQVKESESNGSSEAELLLRTEEEKSSLLTTTSLKGPRSGAYASFERELMRAEISNSEDDAPSERLLELLNGNERAAESPAAKELWDRIRSARQEAGLDPDVPIIRRELIDEETATFYEEEAARMMSYKMTTQEREAFFKQHGSRKARAFRPQQRTRWADVLWRKQQAKDSALVQLVAQKRRDLGETLSKREERLLKNLGAESKPQLQADTEQKPTEPARSQVTEIQADAPFGIGRR